MTRLLCRVCDPKRISQHRVFATDAKRGKTSMGWFYGFKLHLAVNDRGDLLACCLTPGNVDDRAPVPRLVKGLRGKLFGDRGYISAPLAQLLAGTGAPAHHPVAQKHAQISSCISRINCCCANEPLLSRSLTSSRICAQIEHSRHRSPTNFVVHLLAGLIAYSHQDKKPGLHLDERTLLAA